MPHRAVFAGLITEENGNAVTTAYVGASPHYIVNDAGFLRHIPAEKIDRQVLKALQANVLANRTVVVEGMLQFMGQADIFTKAAVESALNNMDENMEQVLQFGLPEETRAWLGLMGFRVVIDLHGDIVDLHLPEGSTFAD